MYIRTLNHLLVYTLSVSESQKLSTVNIVLIAIGVVFFSVGVILAVVLAVLLWKKRNAAHKYGTLLSVQVNEKSFDLKEGI